MTDSNPLDGIPSITEQKPKYNQPAHMSYWDCGRIAVGIVEAIKPFLRDDIEEIATTLMERHAIGVMNMQHQRHREHQDRRKPEGYMAQRRFTGDQPAPDPTIPPGGPLNDVRVELNGVKGAVGEVLQLARGSFEQNAMVSNRLDSIELTLKTEFERIHQQLAYIHHNNGWLESEPEAEEEEAPDPDD